MTSITNPQKVLMGHCETTLVESAWTFCMLHECMQRKLFKKHSQLRDLTWKILTKLACNMKDEKFLQKFNAKYRQNSSEITFPIFHTLFYLRKEILESVTSLQAVKSKNELLTKLWRTFVIMVHMYDLHCVILL